jgi:hypothetical protein
MLGRPIFDDEQFVSRDLLPRNGGINLGGPDHVFNNLHVTGFKVVSSQAALGVAEGTAIATTALLELKSTTKGLLLPRMTGTQRDAISSPPAGLVIFNTTTNKVNVRGASAWEAVTSS